MNPEPHFDHHFEKIKRLSVRRKAVTICIALACEGNKGPACLVLVLDTSISLGGMTSIESFIKGRQLSKFWHVLVAGDDISHAFEVIEGARARMPEIENEDASVNVFELGKVFAEAYQTVRRKQIEDIYLSSFGWTVDKFMNSGNSLLPISEFSSLLAQIQRYDLGCEFLVAGFEYENTTSVEMFHVTNPGVAMPQAPDFAAIGSGAPNAYSYLARREQTASFSLSETVYNGIAAKVLAEKAIGIGEDTAVMIFKSDGFSGMVHNEDKIREIWTKEEENVRPKNLVSRVKKLLEIHEFDEEQSQD